jgi:hypothetical protein
MNKSDDLQNEIKKLGYEVGQTGYRDQQQIDEGGFNFRYWRIPQENYKLKNTPFFYREGNDFIHFTSLEALFSILNSGYIRLYNLLNMDDKFELEYAINELSFQRIDGEIEKAKEQLYCFSMCSANEILGKENELKQHLLWKLHGRNGDGVMLRVSIENNLDMWYNFHLTKVFYNSNNFQDIKQLNLKTDNEFLDFKMTAFLKLPIYEFENEIRLVLDNRNPTTVRQHEKIVYPITYPDKLDKQDKIFYFQLPLENFNSNEDDFDAPNMQGRKYEIPKIKITEVHLGYRFSEIQKKNIVDKYDFDKAKIEVKITDLKKYY